MSATSGIFKPIPFPENTAGLKRGSILVAKSERVEELGDERLYDNAADAARRMARRAVARYNREHNQA